MMTRRARAARGGPGRAAACAMVGSSVAVVPVVLLAVGNSLSFVSTAPVTSLPGWDGPLPSKQDAGHITVDDTLGTSYFYCAQRENIGNYLSSQPAS